MHTVHSGPTQPLRQAQALVTGSGVKGLLPSGAQAPKSGCAWMAGKKEARPRAKRRRMAGTLTLRGPLLLRAGGGAGAWMVFMALLLFDLAARSCCSARTMSEEQDEGRNGTILVLHTTGDLCGEGKGKGQAGKRMRTVLCYVEASGRGVRKATVCGQAVCTKRAGMPLTPSAPFVPSKAEKMRGRRARR